MAEALPEIDRASLSVLVRGAEKTFDNAERLYFEAQQKGGRHHLDQPVADRYQQAAIGRDRRRYERAAANGRCRVQIYGYRLSRASQRPCLCGLTAATWERHSRSCRG